MPKKQSDTPDLFSLSEIEAAYHNSDSPLITDAEYDQLKKPETVGYPVPSGAKTILHAAPMQSLKNAYTKEDLLNFIKTLPKANQLTSILFGELKIDGLSCSIVYRDGHLISAATRGDGVKGEDITEPVRNLPSVPETLPTPITVEIRGELSFSFARFNKLNNILAEKGEKTYATPRNTASGSIKCLDPHEASRRGLEFIAWDVPNTTDNPEFETQESVVSYLRKSGFTTSEASRVFSAKSPADLVDEIWAWSEFVFSERENLEHSIDGIVLKTNSRQSQTELGSRNSSPRWAIALKPPSATAQTTLRAITNQVGSTGNITPVAELEPVMLGGVRVSRATLHNEHQISRLDLRPGDRVLVERAGDVIPKIGRRIGDHAENSVAWEPPLHCPSCGSPTESRLEASNEVARYCTAESSCPGTEKARFTRLVHRDLMDIDGLGENGVEVFYDLGLIKEASDLFLLPEKIMNLSSAVPNWGEGKNSKLKAGIEKARKIPLDRMIASLLIRHLGRSASKTFAAHFQTWDSFLSCAKKIAVRDFDATESLRSLPDVGPIVLKNIENWFSSEKNLISLENLLKEVSVLPAEAPVLEGRLSGETIVFTGTMQSGSRDEMESRAKKEGAKIGKSVSKNTTILVCGEKSGGKKKDAEALQAKGHSIKILSEDEWLQAAK